MRGACRALRIRRGNPVALERHGDGIGAGRLLASVGVVGDPTEFAGPRRPCTTSRYLCGRVQGTHSAVFCGNERRCLKSTLARSGDARSMPRRCSTPRAAARGRLGEQSNIIAIGCRGQRPLRRCPDSRLPRRVGFRARNHRAGSGRAAFRHRPYRGQRPYRYPCSQSRSSPGQSLRSWCPKASRRRRRSRPRR